MGNPLARQRRTRIILQEGAMEWKDFSDTDVVVFAVYFAGGEGRFAHGEDIAVAARSLAPGRFSWQRHPDQIDMPKVLECLAANEDHKRFVAGSVETGWMLSERGAEFVANYEAELPGPGPVLSRLSDEEKRFHPWQKKRIQAHPTYKKIVQGLSRKVTAREAERFFLLDRTMDLSEREGKLDFFTRSFDHDPVIGPVVTLLAGMVRGDQRRPSMELKQAHGG